MPSTLRVELQLRMVSDDDTVIRDEVILQLDKSDDRLEAVALCRRALFLSPHSVFAVLPAAAAKSAVHTIVRSGSQQCPTRSPLCHASHRAFTNRFAATQHKLHSRLLESN
jgi:hypothetical protein